MRDPRKATDNGSMIRASVAARWTGLSSRTIHRMICNGTVRGRKIEHPSGVVRYFVHRDDAIALRDGTPLASEKRDAAKV